MDEGFRQRADARRVSWTGGVARTFDELEAHGLEFWQQAPPGAHLSAICELIYFDEIPPKVTMNEAIELAKLFSTEKSGQFVNGVLDAVVDDLLAASPTSVENLRVIRTTPAAPA